MWRRALFILCITSLILQFTIGEKNETSQTNVTTLYLANPKINGSSEQLNIVAENASLPVIEEMKKLPNRIVNGTKAVLSQFPQQVSLRRRYSQSHFCGGSILSEDWILTAGHCMFDSSNEVLEPYSIIVVAGEIFLKNTKNAHQWSYVVKVIVHPDFDMDTLQNDVALLKLKSSFTFDDFVMPAPVARETMEPRTVCQVSGWGYQKHEGNVVSNILMYVDIPLMPIPLCRKLMANYSTIPPGMFCAGYMEGGRDACQGDSGGGMLCKGYLTGVVSGGEGCAWPRLPGLYGDVHFYVPWISKYVHLPENFTTKLGARNAGSSYSISFPLLLILPTILRHCL